MKKYHLFCLLSLVYGLFNPTLLLANDPSPETARLLASQCAQCHGTTGNSLGDIDSIAGENFDALLAELLEMKADNDNKIMHKQIQAYTDQQLWFLADYYSRLPKTSTELNILPDSEVKDSKEPEDEELSEAQKKILEAEKKALEEAREAKKDKEEEDEEDD